MARSRNARRRNPPPSCCSGCCGGIILVVTCVMMIYGAKFLIQRTLLIEQELLSRINDNTPISGFYGPGAWWAWLITLGLTHGHTLMHLTKAEEEPPEWDYDLIGASAYIVAAAIDLVHKGREISQLGDKASESMLLPALLCAERVVAVGMGSTLFSLATAAYRGSSMVRTTCVAIIPLIFALIASGFSASAHEAIQTIAPVLWCSLHNGSKIEKHDVTPFTLADFPAMVIVAVSYIPRLWVLGEFWLAGAVAAGIAFTVVFGCSAVRRRDVAYAFRSASAAGVGLALLVWLSPVFGAPLAVIGAVKWFFTWVVLWWPVYILAWFPRMGYFPPTGMSALDMDQIAAFLGIVAVATIRGLQPLCNARRFSKSHLGLSRSAHELSPLLPVSSGDMSISEEDVTDTRGGIDGADVDSPAEV
ncbi:hypothetical protein MVEN_00702500 [Mycena venus]|uniref:Uncharacterized protein n=1 Tax=Mycena venus TaxID=2733690 RepID=A0A8H6YIK9_9AGAR|nr:hypothetical protein MVEN_00702500 [Mycena venus]